MGISYRTGRHLGVAGALLAVLVAASGVPAAPPEGGDEALRRALEAGRAVGRVETGSEPACAPEALARFYEARGFEPAWTGVGSPLPRTRALLAILRDAELEGLRSADYRVGELSRLRGPAGGPRPRRRPEELVQLELVATDAALALAKHLETGRADAVTLRPHCEPPDLLHEGWDPAGFLEEALAADDLRAAYGALAPPYPEYRRLRDNLARLRRIEAAGGWPAVPAGEALEPGAADPAVPALRDRLVASGDLRSSPAPPDRLLYDPDLEAAVRRFQAHHGLAADGVVGRRTRAALAVPVERRIDQVRVNLERWRWLPRDLGARHVRVNVAGFELQAVAAGRVELAARVIVGRAYQKTPVFSDRITYMVLNPSWYVPSGIARREILPAARKDPSYLAREGFDVLDGAGPSGRVLDPAGIDWSAVSAQRLPYVLRQRPGPTNSLGRIKFMFPNPFDVYLHDTPARSLFEREVRAFSHGCIRLENPLALADWLLRDDPEWTPERVRAAIDSGAQRTVTLRQPVPIHVQYWTAWAEPDGTLHLRDDVYDRDGAVLEALEAAAVMEGTSGS